MLTDDFVATIRDAANRLRGRQKRAFQAQVAVDYLGGSARRAETVFGWVEKTLGWAKTMTWKGIQPVVCLLDRVYETGIRLTKAALRPYQQRLCRSETLSKWSVTIQPQPPTAPSHD